MPSGRPRYQGLTPREQEVYQLLCQGLTNRQIAEQLGISLDGAKYHVSQILMKLDVSTREEAVKHEQKRGLFGFGAIIFLARKLRAPGMARVTSASVVFGSLLVLSFIAIGSLVVQTRSATPPLAQDQAMTLDGETSAILALLQHIPAATDTTLYYNDYAAIRELLGVPVSGQGASQQESTSYLTAAFAAGMFGGPLYASVNGSETAAANLNRELNLDIAAFDQGIHVRREDDPCGSDSVLLGSFDSASVYTALRHQSVSTKSHDDVSYHVRPSTCWVHNSWGEPAAIVLDSGLVYWSSRSETAVPSMIEAAQQGVPSLAAKAEYRELSQAFADLGVFSAFAEVHSDLRWFEPARAAARAEFGRGEDDPAQSRGNLRPPLGFAMGMGHDSDGTFAVLVILHVSEADAAINAGTLETKLLQGTSYNTGEPWGETFVRSQIEVRATVLQAKLYPRGSMEMIREFQSMGRYFFLLL